LIAVIDALLITIAETRVHFRDQTRLSHQTNELTYLRNVYTYILGGKNKWKTRLRCKYRIEGRAGRRNWMLTKYANKVNHVPEYNIISLASLTCIYNSVFYRGAIDGRVHRNVQIYNTYNLRTGPCLGCNR